MWCTASRNIFHKCNCAYYWNNGNNGDDNQVVGFQGTQGTQGTNGNKGFTGPQGTIGTVQVGITSSSIYTSWSSDGGSESGSHILQGSTEIASTNAIWITGVRVNSSDTDPCLQDVYFLDISGTWWVYADFYFTIPGVFIGVTIYYSTYTTSK